MLTYQWQTMAPVYALILTDFAKIYSSKLGFQQKTASSFSLRRFFVCVEF
jgi:hypothetical protein